MVITGNNFEPIEKEDRMAATKPGEIDRFVRNAHEQAEFMDEDHSSWEEPTCDA